MKPPQAPVKALNDAAKATGQAVKDGTNKARQAKVLTRDEGLKCSKIL
jgi:hypothetical protein